MRLAITFIALLPLLATAEEGSVMTRDELRVCTVQQTALNKHRERLESERVALEDERRALAFDKETLAAEKASLQQDNAAAVQAYNEHAQALDERVEDWNRRSAGFTLRVQEIDAERTTWNRGCGTRRFRADDAAAIRSGK